METLNDNTFHYIVEVHNAYVNGNITCITKGFYEF
jgi:hypothetical protein